jgi:adenylate cyclase
MGDGFLAIFPSGDDARGAQGGVRAGFCRSPGGMRADAASERRRASCRGWCEIGFGLGLHIGNVMFGNVGLEDRLAFSVFGAAVNEASRWNR